MTYSDKEVGLIKSFGFDYLLNQEPSITYSALAMHCFRENLRGDNVDSLRRCFLAFEKGTPYRKTEEFDNLICL